MAGDPEPHDHAGDLGLADRFVVGVADVEQGGGEVVGPVDLAALHMLRAVLPQRRHVLRHAQLLALVRVAEHDGQPVSAPPLDHVGVLAGEAHQLEDHVDRQRVRQAGDPVEPLLGQHVVEQARGDLTDDRLEVRDPAGRERGHVVPANPGVLGRVQIRHDRRVAEPLGEHLAGLRAERQQRILGVRRRELLGVRHHHRRVPVARDHPHVELVAVEGRGLLTHRCEGRVWIGEVFRRERMKRTRRHRWLPFANVRRISSSRVERAFEAGETRGPAAAGAGRAPAGTPQAMARPG